MAKAMEFLRKMRLVPAAKALPETAFDQRMNRLDAIRRVSVARAVLFRTQPARQEA
ncbi:hypothetical protein [Neotabrizicola sp. sgz301269]|uniref:hypothetical protein n=1 Tax=Neotabrizicola sp. sgz301269 TaxID=3276282 RepID=UPI0037705CBB